MLKMPNEGILKEISFLDALQEGVWVADKEGYIVLANRSFARILGYDSPERLKGKVWYELFPPNESTLLKNSSIYEPMGKFYNTNIVTIDNRTVPVVLKLTYQTIDGVNWCIGSLLESSFAWQRNGFPEWLGRQVLENLVDGICLIENEHMVYVNRRLEEMTGYSSHQLRRMSLEEIVTHPDQKPIAEFLRELRHLPAHQEVMLQTRSGQEIECELRLVPIEDGKRRMFLGFFRDISGLKRTERIQTEFIAMVSHDLRTPLATIKEAFSLLSEAAGGQLDKKQRRYLDIAQEGVDRLNRMIENLLEVSWMESGKLTLRFREVEIARLLDAAIDSFSLIVGKKNLKIERHFPEKTPVVLGDYDRLLRAVSNLLDNAIKYSPEGGIIQVVVEILNSNSPILSEKGVPPNNSYLKVTITDQGPGIPSEFLERIFGKFERVDPYGPGIGLGLAIVRSIIELHRGKVWASSTLGEGASFSLILPIKEEGRNNYE
ncbi:MAG: PAS domain S-box protein [candidate division WOR-3 bacterium]